MVMLMACMMLLVVVVVLVAVYLIPADRWTFKVACTRTHAGGDGGGAT